MNGMKGVLFWASALGDLRRFSKSARREAGYQIDRVQRGMEPEDWKPMASIGPGVNEIRIRDKAGAFRVIYVARLADVIHVLHCFGKQTRNEPDGHRSCK